ncbi:ROK family transcriptional regulator [Kutzneria sp. CA-103260]|uniref:ROK family transcriptional regulator n=1 Tax=Kutzneria sp. CA-103260 TaxID=2802641 RepID=UPI001BAE5479|nr:ROK family transcriptional regulator [Kutzneria sp. CA-103260]QUQ64415.1 ROK family transcriptional regulator [Kutzneria sp. CA-103260]
MPTHERIVELLRKRGALTRADLVRLLGVSRATVSTAVGALQRGGLVVETSPATSTWLPQPGRPGALLTLNPSAGAAVGIDFGHTHVRVVIADLAHTVLAEAHEPLARDHDARQAMATAAELTECLLADTDVDRAKVIGVGAGLPGPVDAHTGTIGSSSIAPSWVGLRPADDLATLLDLPVMVDNVANLGALAEFVWGAGQGAKVCAYLKLGTGVGAGIVIDGRLYRGAGGTAAEFGHVTVDPAGEICRCGNRGCLETFVGVPALLGQLQGQYGPNLTAARMIRLATDGDRRSARALADAGHRVGAAAAVLCNLLNPDRVIIGGELAAAGEIMLGPLRAALERDSLPFVHAQAAVLLGKAGDRAEALGAIALVLHSTNRHVARP